MKRLYYMTSTQHAVANIALGRVKISRFSDLNDPFELLSVNLADKNNRALFKEKKDEINSTKGLICMSSNWESPLMWGHYADRHRGIALGFDVEEDKVVKVEYATCLKSADINLESSQPSETCTKDLMKTKFSDWEYENEWRLFPLLKDAVPEGGLYFKEFSESFVLREVILGPECPVAMSRMRKLVSTYVKHAVKVTKSRIAFTRFKVLENRAATRADKDPTTGASRRSGK